MSMELKRIHGQDGEKALNSGEKILRFWQTARQGLARQQLLLVVIRCSHFC
jgi:hypothetical protein